MTIEQQPMCEVGSLINPNNGHVLTVAETALYNKFTEELNRATYPGDREFLMDQRHRHFVSCGEHHAYTAPDT